MKALFSLFLGLFGTFAFSWIGLTVIPNWQIGHLDPQMDEDDIYPTPKSGMVERGRHVYTGNGCFYCHSQQVRPDYVASDIDRKWGVRRSAPRDYVFDRPVMLGKTRMGPDLSNVGKRAPVEDENAPAAGASPAANASPAGSPQTSPAAKPAAASIANAPAQNASPAAASASPAPAANANGSLDSAPAKGEPPTYSAAWHHQHLYSPRSLTLDSNMPAYRFLYEKRRISGERSADALKLAGKEAPSEGWEIVPTYDAKCLVAYLMSLDQSHPLKEVKSAAPASAPAASASPAPAAPAK
jgi:cbb3-type cytochrome oxidase cytochrome c subunit